MMQKHRIRTEIGKNQKLTVELKQDYDLLEILSLKFTQKDLYTSICADYGVICGRISINDGVGVANARVSVFVPLSDEDSEDPIISKLYPFTTTTDTTEEGYRYNLLPSRKQHTGHTPTGTFPDQEDILSREEVLEVYEKYYKYTVKTNDSGDFMIWGVPVGRQTLHVDVDLSDMGCNSLTPYDLVYDGESKEKFENMYTYMSSDNLDGLPQIVKFEQTIEVYPFWGNEDLCEIGITRTDFDLKDQGIRIEPYAIMMGGTFTDSGKDALRVNCNVDNQMGEKCRLTTFMGDVEAIRFTGLYEKNADGTINRGRPILEAFPIDSQINEDGVYFFRVPMNLKRLITNEFGEMEETIDPTKGIPTQGNYRFRFSLNEDTGERNRFTGKYLVPNIREYHINDTNNLGGHTTINEKSYAFSTNLDDYPAEAIDEIAGTSTEAIDANQKHVPQDYFYQFRHGRVFAASSFINQYYKKSGIEKLFSFLVRDRNESFIGIKEIWPSEKDDCSQTNNYFPINDAVRNHRFNFFILTIISFIEYIGLRIQLFFKEITTQILFAIAEILAGTGVTKKAAAKMFRRAKEFQFRNIFKLRLITYPDCYDCEEDNEEGETSILGVEQYNVNEDFVDAVLAGTDLSNVDPNISTGTTASSLGGFTFLEQYAVALDNCSDYTVSNGTGASVTLTYNNCEGVSQTFTIADGASDTVRGAENQNSTFTNAGLSSTETTLGAGTFNADDDLYFPATFNIVNAPSNPEEGDFLFNTYIFRVDAYGAGIVDSSGNPIVDTYLTVGLGQQFPIVYSSGQWVVQGLYGVVNDSISEAFNTPADEPVDDTAHRTQGEVLIDNVWYIETIDVDDVDFVESESGCSKYDTIIEDESGRTGDMKLRPLLSPLTGSSGNIHTTYADARDDLLTNRAGGGLFGSAQWGSIPLWYQYSLTTSSEYFDEITGVNEVECEPRNPYNVLAVMSHHNKRFTYQDANSFKNNVVHCVINGQYYGKVKKKGPYWVDSSLVKDGTVSGYSEFRDGVFTIVPLAGRTGELLNSYRRRKLFGKLMCGGVVSYTFANSWLNGAMYFFQFMKRSSTRFCKDCVKRIKDDTGVHYYYRSTPFDPNYNHSETQYNYDDNGNSTGVNSTLTTEYQERSTGFYGSRKGVLYPNTDGLVISQVEINFPTTVVDLGPRNTWLKEVCVDPELDPNCSVSRSIGSTSYKGLDDLMEYIIQSKEIKEKGRLDVQDLFDSRSAGKIDGDIAQLMNFNTQTGIYPFEFEELDSPYTAEYSTLFDSKGPVGLNLVFSEDDPDTVELEQAGELVRECLNEPTRLGDNSQRIPYFMWDTRGHGFGENLGNGENQNYEDDLIYNQRLQQMRANLNTDLNTDPADDNYYNPYLLPPIRDCLERNGVKKKSHDNYKEYTVDGQRRHLMEIGSPFHYHLGLRKGKTAYDKFIENFGPR